MADVVPPIRFPLTNRLPERRQVHVSPETLLSGSSKVAVTGVPTCGWSVDRVIVPSSFKLLTLIVTLMRSVADEGSVAVTLILKVVFSS